MAGRTVSGIHSFDAQNTDMRRKLICSLLAGFYLLEAILLSLDLLGVYEQVHLFPLTGFPWQWRLLSSATAAGCFYYMAWCLWKNPFDRKITLMLGTTMLLALGIDFTGCCLKTAYKLFLGIADIVSVMFLIYSLRLLIEVTQVQKT